MSEDQAPYGNAKIVNEEAGKAIKRALRELDFLIALYTLDSKAPAISKITPFQLRTHFQTRLDKLKAEDPEESPATP